MSETSTPYTSAFIFTSVAGNEIIILAEEIKKYDMAKFIDFLHRKKDLDLNDNDLKIIHKEKINGRIFINITEEKS